jgi:endonuclease-3
VEDKRVTETLNLLDQTYGTEKDGFYYKEPWQLLTAIMLSAQSTDKQVDEALPALFDRFQKLEDVAKAPVEEIEELIKSIGLYHSKAKNIKKCSLLLLEEYGGKVPKTMEELIKLPGVGRKTANLFLADMYQIPGITVDTHVNRISNRLGWAASKDPVLVEEQLKRVLPKDHWIRINIQLIRHGRAVCRARNPKCSDCILEKNCRKIGIGT